LHGLIDEAGFAKWIRGPELNDDVGSVTGFAQLDDGVIMA
jgi:hypothetical protein